MTRSTLLPLGLTVLVVLSGCSAVDAQRYPTPRRGGEVYRPADHRNDRYDQRNDARVSQQRVRRDVREYVRLLDRELRLSERQEDRIAEILENRTIKLLRESRSRSAYPFPRDFRRGERDRELQRFWRDADGRVERILDRRQTREYRQITSGRRNDRYRDDRRDRDDRYRDDRRDRDDDRRRGRDRD